MSGIMDRGIKWWTDVSGLVDGGIEMEGELPVDDGWTKWNIG
jgi:hypothetical protein